MKLKSTIILILFCSVLISCEKDEYLYVVDSHSINICNLENPIELSDFIKPKILRYT